MCEMFGRFFFLLTVDMVDVVDSSLVIVDLLPPDWELVPDAFLKIGRFC